MTDKREDKILIFIYFKQYTWPISLNVVMSLNIRNKC